MEWGIKIADKATTVTTSPHASTYLQINREKSLSSWRVALIAVIP
jgi:hypothetical protein